MKYRRFLIYPTIILISIGMYLYYRGGLIESVKNSDVDSYDAVRLTQEYVVNVKNVKYARGSFYVVDTKNNRNRLDALDFLEYGSVDYSNLIGVGDSLIKRTDSDTLLIIDQNLKTQKFILLDDIK